uniref:Uncharacterized protein n=1 Tax=Anguilla anguilla TaxID=7936 RepID=A0A0E9PFK2_ANGAN
MAYGQCVVYLRIWQALLTFNSLSGFTLKISVIHL